MRVSTGLQDGGAEAVLVRLRESDRMNRHTVISVLGPGKYGDQLKKAGIQVLCLRIRRGRFSLASFLRPIGIIMSKRPDTVQTWMYHGSLLSGLAAR